MSAAALGDAAAAASAGQTAGRRGLGRRRRQQVPQGQKTLSALHAGEGRAGLGPGAQVIHLNQFIQTILYF